MVHTGSFTASSVADARVRWVTLAGELDLRTAPVLRDELNRAESHAPHTVVLDLSGLSFMDCVALRAVIEFADGARTRGSQLRIVSPPPRVARIFALTGTAETLGIGRGG